MNMFTYVRRFAVIGLLLTLASCGSEGDETASNEGQPQQESSDQAQYPSEDQAPSETLIAKEPATPPATKAETKPATKPAPKKEEPPPAPATATIPEGTTVVVSLVTHLRTDSNKVGDLFNATVDDALVIDGKTVLTAGSQVQGRLIKVEEPHRTSGRAQLTLLFDALQTADGSETISTVPIELIAEADKISDEEKVAAGGVIGGVIGALTSKKKGKGAAVGAAVGAAAGGAIAVATKGKQLDLPPGQKFSVEFAQPVEVPVVKAQ